MAAGVQIGLVAAQTGGGIRQLHPQVADMPVALLLQAFHQQPHGTVVVVANRRKPLVFACQHHHFILPWAEHGRRQAGETEQDHSVDITLLQNVQMLFHQPGLELAFHHDRVEAVLIQQWQHGAYRLVFRRRVETGNDNADHFVALAAHGASRLGRGEPLLTDHRFHPFAGLRAHAAFVVQHA
ncbi:hypothetical protein D3C78_1238850 [compost metagenome]